MLNLDPCLAHCSIARRKTVRMDLTASSNGGAPENEKPRSEWLDLVYDKVVKLGVLAAVDPISHMLDRRVASSYLKSRRFSSGRGGKLASHSRSQILLLAQVLLHNGNEDDIRPRKSTNATSKESFWVIAYVLGQLGFVGSYRIIPILTGSTDMTHGHLHSVVAHQ